MKKLVLYFFVLIPAIGFNQVVNHFENTNSQWFVASNFINANQENPDHLGVKTRIYRTIGDTIIDNSNWLKLYFSQDSLFQNNILSIGFIRSEGSKVYYKNDAISQSHLIYDFDLEVGDSVEYTFYFDGFKKLAWLKVLEIETIEIQGETYKKFIFSEPIPQDDNGTFPITMGSVLHEVWIENIGSTRGPIFPSKPFMIDSEWGQKVDLTCSFTNETQYYHNSYYTDCYIYDVLGVEKLQNEFVKIYPNPAKDFLTISNLQNDEIDVEMTNNLGQIVLNMEINDNQNKVDIRKLKNGIYFLKFKHGESIQTFKIIKE